MKTLINKTNPQIRITAPEIRVGPDSYYLKTDGHYGFIFRKIRWTLVEEEPEKQTSKYLKEPDYDKQVVEKMSKELAKIITDQIVEPVDLENEAVAFCFDNGINITPYQATRIARHFYELGRKGGSK